MSPRRDGRSQGDLRPITIEPGVAPWAEGSALITMGDTRVWCTATIEERVPQHRRGTRTGWVTAEYAMLPRATQQRSSRERGGRVDGRSQEIQRLVARSLRRAVDMKLLGERTVIVDCDVIHADGGTRTASINGGLVALALATKRLLEAGMVSSSPLLYPVAAVGAGIIAGVPMIDLDYVEDSTASTDMNVVMSADGRIIEIQGTAEEEPFSDQELDGLLRLARAGIAEIVLAQRSVLGQ